MHILQLGSCRNRPKKANTETLGCHIDEHITYGEVIARKHPTEELGSVYRHTAKNITPASAYWLPVVARNSIVWQIIEVKVRHLFIAIAGGYVGAVSIASATATHAIASPISCHG